MRSSSSPSRGRGRVRCRGDGECRPLLDVVCRSCGTLAGAWPKKRRARRAADPSSRGSMLDHELGVAVHHPSLATRYPRCGTRGDRRGDRLGMGRPSRARSRRLRGRTRRAVRRHPRRSPVERHSGTSPRLACQRDRRRRCRAGVDVHVRGDLQRGGLHRCHPGTRRFGARLMVHRPEPGGQRARTAPPRRTTAEGGDRRRPLRAMRRLRPFCLPVPRARCAADRGFRRGDRGDLRGSARRLARRRGRPQLQRQQADHDVRRRSTHDGRR